MCYRRRVFFSCLHEDLDVTPPRSLLFCHDAKPSENSDINRDGDGDGDSSSSCSSSNLKPCAAVDTLPLTSKLDYGSGVIRSEPCEACAADTGFRPHNRTVSEVRREREDEDGRESTSRNGSFGLTDTTPEDTAEQEEEEEDDIFVFDWDGDNSLLSDPRREAGRSSESADGVDPFPIGQTFVKTVRDFQLYDDEDEFADELKEIGSKER
ncbi:hypothetical protein F5Y06DRAFT_281256 [Hypoxylon sp. FL0890]|nr:hypothetical protein F5Y06DRAFT_281256 [Hypoxylon sp. FL0890]